MTAIIVGFFIPWLALAMWLYFDATERGKPSIVWAGGVFFLGTFGLIPLVLYLIVRDTGRRQLEPPGGGRRQYLYIVSFAGVGTLMLGLTLLLTTTIARAISEDAIGRDGYREALASSFAAIIVFISALWLLGGGPANALDGEEIDLESWVPVPLVSGTIASPFPGHIAN